MLPLLLLTQPDAAEELQQFCDITAGWADMADAVQPGAVQPGLAASLGEMEDLLQDMGLWLNGMGRLDAAEGGETRGSVEQGQRQGRRQGQGQGWGRGQELRGERGWGPPDEFLEGLGVHLLAYAQAAGWEATEEVVRAGLARLRGLGVGGAAAPAQAAAAAAAAGVAMPTAAAAGGGLRGLGVGGAAAPTQAAAAAEAGALPAAAVAVPAAAGATRLAATAGSTAVVAARAAGGRGRAVPPPGPLMAPLSADAAQGAPAVSLHTSPPYRGASAGGTTLIPIPMPAPGHAGESNSLRQRVLNTQQAPVAGASETAPRPRVVQSAPADGSGATGPADAADAATAVGTPALGTGQPVGVLTPGALGEQGVDDAVAATSSWADGVLGRRWRAGRQGRAAAAAGATETAAAGAAAGVAGAGPTWAGVLGRRVATAAAAVGSLCGEPRGEEEEAQALRRRVVAWNEAFARIMWVARRVVGAGVERSAGVAVVQTCCAGAVPCSAGVVSVRMQRLGSLRRLVPAAPCSCLHGCSDVAGRTLFRWSSRSAHGLAVPQPRPPAPFPLRTSPAPALPLATPSPTPFSQALDCLALASIMYRNGTTGYFQLLSLTTFVLLLRFATGVVTATAWLLLPRASWAAMLPGAIRCRYINLLAAKLLASVVEFPEFRKLNSYHKGVGMLLIEGLLLPGTCLVSIFFTFVQQCIC